MQRPFPAQRPEQLVRDEVDVKAVAVVVIRRVIAGVSYRLRVVEIIEVDGLRFKVIRVQVLFQGPANSVFPAPSMPLTPRTKGRSSFLFAISLCICGKSAASGRRYPAAHRSY